MDELLKDLCKQFDYFYKIDQIISTVDLLYSLASYKINSLKELAYSTEPRFAKCLDLQNFVHPILPNLLQNKYFSMTKLLNTAANKFTGKPQQHLITNNINACETKPFILISGANMSGKSTLLKSIGIGQIMAQCACSLPASFATFSLKKQVLSRAGETFNQLNASSFEHEMLEMKYILDNMNGESSADSLILIDELCRSTNFNEGLALSIAICEHILHTISRNLYEKNERTYVFYASHYAEISCLEYLYPKVTGFCLDSTYDQNMRIKHSYKLKRGYCEQENYGKL